MAQEGIFQQRRQPGAGGSNLRDSPALDVSREGSDWKRPLSFLQPTYLVSPAVQRSWGWLPAALEHSTLPAPELAQGAGTQRSPGFARGC